MSKNKTKILHEKIMKEHYSLIEGSYKLGKLAFDYFQSTGHMYIETLFDSEKFGILIGSEFEKGYKDALTKHQEMSRKSISKFKSSLGEWDKPNENN
jgi:leucyl aminopeptidase (aminopeptidase T)